MPTQAQHEVAAAALAAVDKVFGHPADLLYARVGLVIGPDGRRWSSSSSTPSRTSSWCSPTAAAGRLVDAVAARI